MNILELNQIFDNPVDPRLGCYIPDDTKHLEKYPYKLEFAPEQPTPIQIGIPWFEAFDRPFKKDNRWWVEPDPKKLGKVRGGHSVMQPVKSTGIDTLAWYLFYDQILEG